LPSVEPPVAKSMFRDCKLFKVQGSPSATQWSPQLRGDDHGTAQHGIVQHSAHPDTDTETMFAIIKSSFSVVRAVGAPSVALSAPGMLSISALFMQQRFGSRGGARGDTYQPNTLKRKRRLGFLARMKSRTGRNIVKRRFEKGRWFLTH
jgi:ribosomal protein L34